MKRSCKKSRRTYWFYRDCVTCREFLRPFFLAFSVTLLLLAMLCGFLLVEQAAQQLGTADSKRLAVWEEKGESGWHLEVMGYPLEPPEQIKQTLSAFYQEHFCLVPAPFAWALSWIGFSKIRFLPCCRSPKPDERGVLFTRRESSGEKNL